MLVSVPAYLYIHAHVPQAYVKTTSRIAEPRPGPGAHQSVC